MWIVMFLIAMMQCDGTPEPGPIWVVLTAERRNADLTIGPKRDIFWRQTSPGWTEGFDLSVLVPDPPLGTVELVGVEAVDVAGNRSSACDETP